MSTDVAPPFLVALLQTNFPSNERLDLLKACLLPGPAGHDAFRRWHDKSTDPRLSLAASVGGGRLLAAMLHRAAVQGAWDMDPALRTQLRVAAEHERRRATAYAGVVGEVAGLFGNAAVPFLALKGAALATAYPDPSLRHSHDIDVLTPLEGLGHAAETLRLAGYVSPPGSEPLLGALRTWVHPSGCPVQLHRWPFTNLRYSLAMEDLWTRTATQSVAGGSMQVLGAEDALVHGLVHASTGSHRASMLWVTDAFFVAGMVRNWNLVASIASRDGLNLPAAAALRFLREALDVSVPDDVLTEVDARATGASRASREIALHSLLPGRRRIWNRARGRAERWFVLRWAVVPSSGYMTWLTGYPNWAIAFAHVRRWLRWLARRVST